MTTHATTPHRNPSWHLDPYVVDATITLQEWRKIRRQLPAVHVVARHDDDHRSAA